MKTTWSRMLILSAVLAALPTTAGAADGWPVVLSAGVAQDEPQRIVLPAGGQSSSRSTDRSTISFVNAPSEQSATSSSNDAATRAPAPVYRRPPPKRTVTTARPISQAEPRQLATEESAPQYEAIPLPASKRPSDVKMAVPRLMAEASPARLEDQTTTVNDHEGEPHTSRRRRAVTAADSADTAESSRVATQPIRLQVVDESAAPMALATDAMPQRIPPVTEDSAEAPRLLTATPGQIASARKLTAGASGPVLRRAPLADRLAALQDQVPTSYVGIQGRVGAINLGDQTVKLNFDRRQPPPLSGVVKIYQAQPQGTTCVGALKIIRVYGGIATGSPVGDLEVNRLMAGDLAVFNVGADLSTNEKPDPNEVIWVSDRIRSVRR